MKPSALKGVPRHDREKEKHLSRSEIIAWINSSLNLATGSSAHITTNKVEQLASGEAYCTLFALLYPKHLNIKKVKMRAAYEHEFISNLKLLQEGLTQAGVNKVIPIEKLSKAKPVDNLEFAQWFIGFFERKRHKLDTEKPNSLDLSFLSQSGLHQGRNAPNSLHELDSSQQQLAVEHGSLLNKRKPLDQMDFKMSELSSSEFVEDLISASSTSCSVKDHFGCQLSHTELENSSKPLPTPLQVVTISPLAVAGSEARRGPESGEHSLSEALYLCGLISESRD